MKHGLGARKLVVLVLFGILFGGVLIACLNGSTPKVTTVAPRSASLGDPLLDGNVTQVSRAVFITKYMLTEVYDTYTYKNNGSLSLTKFIFCTDSDYDAQLLYVTASGVAGDSFPSIKKTLVLNGYQAYEVDLLEPLSPGSSQKIMVTSVYANLTSTSGDYQTQSCNFNFNMYPISPYKIFSFECTISLPPKGDGNGATADSFYPDPPVKSSTSGTWTIDNVEAFSKLPMNVNYTYSDAPILQMNSLNRRITIDPWGYLNIQEDHVLLNTGQIPVNSYSYRIPCNATDFSMWDDLGGIQGWDVSNEINTDGKTKNVTINLNVNRARILGGNQFKYTTSYLLPFEMYLSSSWNTYYFNLQTFTSQMDFLIVSGTTQIFLQTGLTLDEDKVTPTPDELVIDQTNIILTYSDSMISPFNDRIVQITWQVNGFWMMLRPLLFILIILAVASGYVFVRKVMRREVPATLIERINIPTKSLQEFVQIYEEKSALLRELDQLNEDVKVKKVVKREYTKRVNNILGKKKEIEEDLKPLAKVIADSDERFKKSIEKLQFLEAERLSIEDSIKALEGRYRRGAIPSRSAYLKLTSDFIKRLEKIQNDIDKLLNELKSFIY